MVRDHQGWRVELLCGISARSHFKSIPVLLPKEKETPRGGLCKWAEAWEETQQGSLGIWIHYSPCNWVNTAKNLQSTVRESTWTPASPREKVIYNSFSQMRTFSFCVPFFSSLFVAQPPRDRKLWVACWRTHQREKKVLTSPLPGVRRPAWSWS